MELIWTRHPQVSLVPDENGKYPDCEMVAEYPYGQVRVQILDSRVFLHWTRNTNGKVFRKTREYKERNIYLSVKYAVLNGMSIVKKIVRLNTKLDSNYLYKYDD